MPVEIPRFSFDRLRPSPIERDVRRISEERKTRADNLKLQRIPLGDIPLFVDNEYSALEQLYREKTGTELLGDPYTAAEHPIPITKTCSIVIPAYESGKPLEQTLRAIEASSFNAKYPGKLEIIIADDASPKTDIGKLVESFGIRDLNITVVRNKTNGRENKARYSGLLAAKGDIVIFTTQDVAYSPTLIEEYMKRHEVLPDISLFAFRDRINPDDSRLSPEAISRGSLADFPYGFRDDGRTKAMADTHGFKESGYGRQVPLDVLDRRYHWNLPSMGWGISISAPRETLLKTKASFDPRYLGFGGDDEHLVTDLIADGLYVIPLTAGIVHHIEHPSRWDPTDAAKNAQVFADNMARPPQRQIAGRPEMTDYTVVYRQTNSRHEAKRATNIPKGNGYDKALCLLRTGQYENAVKAFDSAKSAHSDDGWFWHDYGLALRRGGEAAVAVAALERSKALLGDNTWVESSLASAYAQAGRSKDSLNAYKHALELDPSNADAALIRHSGSTADHVRYLAGQAHTLAVHGAHEEALKYANAAEALSREL